MAIKTRSVTPDGKREMTIEEFKKWLKKFDKDKDGKISRDELREAVRAKGGWFSTHKSKRGLKLADINSNGFIDDSEISNLVEFAQRELGIRIVEHN